MAALGKNVYVFGGYEGSSRVNTLLVYYTDRAAWVRLQPEGEKGILSLSSLPLSLSLSLSLCAHFLLLLFVLPSNQVPLPPLEAIMLSVRTMSI